MQLEAKCHHPHQPQDDIEREYVVGARPGVDEHDPDDEAQHGDDLGVDHGGVAGGVEVISEAQVAADDADDNAGADYLEEP